MIRPTIGKSDGFQLKQFLDEIGLQSLVGILAIAHESNLQIHRFRIKPKLFQLPQFSLKRQLKESSQAQTGSLASLDRIFEESHGDAVLLRGQPRIGVTVHPQSILAQFYLRLTLAKSPLGESGFFVSPFCLIPKIIFSTVRSQLFQFVEIAPCAEHFAVFSKNFEAHDKVLRQCALIPIFWCNLDPFKISRAVAQLLE